MIRVSIPGRGQIEIEHLALDINGTLTLDGALLSGVEEALERLSDSVTVTLVTCDTLGTGAAIARQLGAELRRVDAKAGREAERKAEIVWDLGAERTAAIGNGGSDHLMLAESALGIAVLGPEGLAAAALRGADVICASIQDALGLLATPKRLISTLRT